MKYKQNGTIREIFENVFKKLASQQIFEKNNEDVAFAIL
jgi:hypothetical protein